MTRMSLVVKKVSLSPQSSDENRSRRQKMKFFASKRWRESVSSSKKWVSRLKMMTRMSLVVKKWSFSPQNGDENRSRRQKSDFLASKWWRESVSSSKNGVCRLKMMTRMSLVVKKWSFSPQNGDENGSRRQKSDFLASKWWREWVSSSKKWVCRLKMVTRMGLVVKKVSLSPQNGDENRSRRQKMEFLASKWWRELISLIWLVS
jgi:hypothetical protein